MVLLSRRRSFPMVFEVEEGEMLRDEGEGKVERGSCGAVQEQDALRTTTSTQDGL